jgi:hypothetical protein
MCEATRNGFETLPRDLTTRKVPWELGKQQGTFASDLALLLPDAATGEIPGQPRARLGASRQELSMASILAAKGVYSGLPSLPHKSHPQP